MQKAWKLTSDTRGEMIQNTGFNPELKSLQNFTTKLHRYITEIRD